MNLTLSVIFLCLIFLKCQYSLASVPKSRAVYPTGNAELLENGNLCPKMSSCVPSVQCPAHVLNSTKILCNTRTNRMGICCFTGQNHTGPLDEKFRGHHRIAMDPVTMGAVARRSRAELAELRSREARILMQSPSNILFPGSPSYSHVFRNSRMFNMADFAEVMDVASRALELTIATRAFKDRQGLSNYQIEMGFAREQDLKPSPFASACTSQPLCPYYLERYRRIDGTCNNARHPTWGGPMTPYSRLLPPSYNDGVYTPRLAKRTQQPLASPRLISATIFSDKDVPNDDRTLMVMQFGQFLSHDLTQSIDTSYANGSTISCCTQDGSAELPIHLRHHACMPIEIPKNDSFYGTFDQQCMNFVRSVLAPNHDCTLGYAQQMNKITHFLDGSAIYGSTREQTSELRSFSEGRLKVFHDFGRDLLPLSRDPGACVAMEAGSACFISGDTRSNQMISLVALHTIFVREHNRIAAELLKLNPLYSDEKLFLEARQIVIAELQVITYKEFLPAVIGDLAMEDFQLSLAKDDSYSYDYDPNIEPSITNEFATAALRFGHSTVSGLLKIYGLKNMEEMIAIPEVMFEPSRLRKRLFLDELLSTLTTEPMQEVDNNIAEALTKYMFRSGMPFGVDIASLNIQRGRDHGLRPYNHYRDLVGLPKITNFNEFGPEMGYTFRDIVADQFYRLKKGDTYFFENHPGINGGYFTPDQLMQLRKASMSRLICDNSDGILLAHLAPNAFRKPGVPGNEFVDCSGPEIPRVDLSYWRTAN